MPKYDYFYLLLRAVANRKCFFFSFPFSNMVVNYKFIYMHAQSPCCYNYGGKPAMHFLHARTKSFLLFKFSEGILQRSFPGKGKEFFHSSAVVLN